MEELLQELNITKKGTIGEDGSYVVDIDTYEEYGKFYTILEKAEKEGVLSQLDDQSIITVHTTDIAYLYEDEDSDTSYEISLLGDLDQDIYKLVVNEF